VVLSFVFSGIACFFCALCYSELASMVPSSGSAYAFANATLGPIPGFAVGWIDWLGHCAGLAWVTITIGEFARGLVPALPPGGKAVALFTLVGFALLQRLGLRARTLDSGSGQRHSKTNGKDAGASAQVRAEKQGEVHVVPSDCIFYQGGFLPSSCCH
jgi:hypothetical protein